MPIRRIGMESAGSGSAIRRQHCRSRLYPADSEDDEALFLGDDEHFVPIEVMAVELDDGDLLVIHAMKLRRKYREAYEEVTAWSRP